MCSSEISAPTWVAGSSGSPIVIAPTRATSLREELGRAPCGARRRACRSSRPRPRNRSCRAARRRRHCRASASSKTISGDLPPSSSVTCLERARRRRHHRLAGADRAGQRHLGDRPDGASSRRPVSAVALHDVEDAGRQARPRGKISASSTRRERRQLGRLEDHRVAAGERRRRLPAGDLQRIVPGADAGDDAERLAARVAEGLRAEVDVLAGRALRERRRNTRGTRRRRSTSTTRVSWIGLPVSRVSSSRARRCARAGSRRRGAGCGRARRRRAPPRRAAPRARPGRRPRPRRDRPRARSPSRSPVAGLKDVMRSEACLRAVMPSSARLARDCRANSRLKECERSFVSAVAAGQARPVVWRASLAFLSLLPLLAQRRGRARVLPHRALLGHRLDRRHGDDGTREPSRAPARLRARGHRAVGAGDLRVAEEPRHRRLPRQLDAGAGGGPRGPTRPRARSTSWARTSKAPSTRSPCRPTCTRPGSTTSRTSSASRRSSSTRSTASSPATTATASC